MHIRSSGATVEVLSPAKVNLWLAVRGKRNDGYHELETLLLAIGLYDTLRFSARPTGPITLTCRRVWGDAAQDAAGQPGEGDHTTVSPRCELLPEGEENLVYRAAQLLRERAGSQQGAAIELVKRIPMAAGLGGGSSDAAATLLAANRAWGLGWSRQRLAELGAELGSDVPFFLTGGAALCRGRGEQIEPQHLPSLPLVVVRPPSGLRTPDVYARCRPDGTPFPIPSWLETARRGDWGALRDCLRNDLRPAAEGLTDGVRRVLQTLERQDLWGQQMSGSGSSCFGVCRSLRQARRVAARLRAAGLGRVFVTTGPQPAASW